jgi:hypothetical protein
MKIRFSLDKKNQLDGEFVHPFEEELIDIVNNFNENAVNTRVSVLKKIEGIDLKSNLSDLDYFLTLDNVLDLSTKRDLQLDRVS